MSLLFIDCDLYEPTRAALRAFLPRMPKGAIVAFDELDNPIWPGETPWRDRVYAGTLNTGLKVGLQGIVQPNLFGHLGLGILGYNASGAVLTHAGADGSGALIFPNMLASDEVNLRNALAAVIGRFSSYTANFLYGVDGKLHLRADQQRVLPLLGVHLHALPDTLVVRADAHGVLGTAHGVGDDSGKLLRLAGGGE